MESLIYSTSTFFGVAVGSRLLARGDDPQGQERQLMIPVRSIGYDPYRIFALTLIRHAVSSVDGWIKRERLSTLATRAETEAEQAAVVGYLWLSGISQGRRGLSFRRICDGLGIDHAVMRARIFAQWDRHPGRLDVLIRKSVVAMDGDHCMDAAA